MIHGFKENALFNSLRAGACETGETTGLMSSDNRAELLSCAFSLILRMSDSQTTEVLNEIKECQ